MDVDLIAKKISDLMPGTATYMDAVDQSIATEAAENLVNKEQNKEVQKARRKQERILAAVERRAEERAELARFEGCEQLPVSCSAEEASAKAQQQRTKEAIEVIDTTVATLPSAKDKEMLRLQGTSRPEIAKLLLSLNINLSVQLTRNDTANLLACLLTCNETQLRALRADGKVPVAIKMVIGKLLKDMQKGEMDTVERLWDRVFGKGPLQMSLPTDLQAKTGILPDAPVSREAYVIIRDTLMK